MDYFKQYTYCNIAHAIDSFSTVFIG